MANFEMFDQNFQNLMNKYSENVNKTFNTLKLF